MLSQKVSEQGYTSSDKLSIIGGSAGGLLIVRDMRPELYNAAVADVPFVDVVTTMLDDSIPSPQENGKNGEIRRQRIL